jgi:hypothetical protein
MIAELTVPSRLIHGRCTASMASDLSNDGQTFGKGGIFGSALSILVMTRGVAFMYTINHLPVHVVRYTDVDRICRDALGRIATANGSPAARRNGCIQSTI